jgi:hypothetical protein
MERNMLAVAFWCVAACGIILLLLLWGQRRRTARLRKRVSLLEGAVNIRDEELRHLVSNRLPALTESLYGRPVDVPGSIHPKLSETAYGRNLDAVSDMFHESVGQAKARADESAKATLKSMMRGVQSLANEQQLVISKMQLQHDDPDVLQGLLAIDHMNAQLGRRAQASAVLCGSWPGQQRSASAIIDVVRGATSRIRDYLRVQVNPQVNVAVVSRAVEPVVLAVAELLDNAARHSQPNAPVEVNFQPAHNGMAIVIDDAGVAMTPEELQRAARLLSGEESVDINRLGDPPQVGFAVVGVLAARYGFSVSVDTRSPYGGVRAVVFLPTALLTRSEDRPKAMVTTPAPEPVNYDVPDMPPETSVTTATTANGLPRRRRVSLETDQAAPVSERPDAGPSTRPARKTAAGLGAWQRGTRSGRATVPPDSEGNPPA